ncbi:MAG: site-2 protease family protein [Polyangiaceae bacterium]
MQPIEPGPLGAPETAGAPCANCGIVLAPALLSCPKCRALVHRTDLETIATGAERASARGDIGDALATWRKALPLLPSESKQHARITALIRELREQLDRGVPAQATRAHNEQAAVAPAPAKTGWRRYWGAGGSAIAFLVLKLKSVWLLLLTGWKPLLMGLTKLTTIWSMLLSLGVYWGLYGWKFALGLVLCIYVHEIGHVVALKRLGIAAGPPMFIPGFGAVVRLKEYPADVDEDAQVGLAGPRWGLGVSVFVFLLARFTGSGALTAIAHTSAWINLFNLIPIPPLDGGRGFRALGNQQRLIVAAGLGVVYLLTGQAFVGIIALLAVARGFEKRPNATQNARILFEFLGLATLLALIARGG